MRKNVFRLVFFLSLLSWSISSLAETATYDVTGTTDMGDSFSMTFTYDLDATPDYVNGDNYARWAPTSCEFTINGTPYTGYIDNVDYSSFEQNNDTYGTQPFVTLSCSDGGSFVEVQFNQSGFADVSTVERLELPATLSGGLVFYNDMSSVVSASISEPSIVTYYVWGTTYLDENFTMKFSYDLNATPESVNENDAYWLPTSCEFTINDELYIGMEYSSFEQHNSTEPSTIALHCNDGLGGIPVSGLKITFEQPNGFADLATAEQLELPTIHVYGAASANIIEISNDSALAVYNISGTTETNDNFTMTYTVDTNATPFEVTSDYARWEPISCSVTLDGVLDNASYVGIFSPFNHFTQMSYSHIAPYHQLGCRTDNPVMNIDISVLKPYDFTNVSVMETFELPAVLRYGTISDEFGYGEEIISVKITKAGANNGKADGSPTISGGYTHACAVDAVDGEPTCWGDSANNKLNVPVGMDFVQVNVGGDFACAIRGSDDSIACWGADWDNQISNAPSNTGYVQVSAGDSHACALHNSGSIECWGNDSSGQVSAKPEGTNFVQIAAGNQHNCALTASKTVQCWGDNSMEQSSVLIGWHIIAVTAGAYYSCVLISDGTVYCWGDSVVVNSTPQSNGFTQISAGYTNVCALHESGSLTCWGSNSDVTDNVPTGTHFAAIGVGMGDFACAVHKDGDAECWGDNSMGQSTVPSGLVVLLDNPTGPEPVSTGDGNPRVSGSDTNTCALESDGSIVCWGSDEFGQVSGVPQGETDFVQVSTGEGFVCAVHSSGTVSCWGKNDTSTNYVVDNTPTESIYTAISVSMSHVCAIADDGNTQRIDCWGDNSEGQTNAPMSGFGYSNYTQVSVGGDSSCALTEDGNITCWGDDYNGSGDAPLDTGYVQISSGYHHHCALHRDGHVQCWGGNDSGQVTNQPSSLDFIRVTAGGEHSCALRNTGEILCWGNDSSGQVSLTPTGTDFIDIDSGYNHNCAVKTDGKLKCWGADSFGQISLMPSTLGDSICNDIATPAGIPQLECEALAALYKSANGYGYNWNDNTNWLSTTPANTWYGITVSNGHVTEVDLSNNQLAGTIPVELGNLTQLQSLQLEANQLSGTIPTELGNLTQLQSLQLWYNQLSGTIPTELGNLTQLQVLTLDSNQLTGTVPIELTNLTQLEVLYLGYNQLSGDSPAASMATWLSGLQEIDISYNNCLSPSDSQIQSILTSKDPDWASTQNQCSNTAPTASNVSLTGTLQEGQTLTGSYTFTDTDGDSDTSSTYQWLRADDAQLTTPTNITGATSQTYTLTSDDVGQYVAFCVTPSDGTNFGTEACSTGNGPITAAGSTNSTSSDFNGDDKSDLVWQRSTGELAAWYMDGTVRIGSAGLGSVADTEWQVVGVEDFNNDSKSDLVWQHATGELAVWYMDGTARIGSAGLGSVADTEWQVVGVEDFNSDNKPDLVWQRTSGELAVWYMNGTTRIGSEGLGSVADTEWQVIGVGDFNNDSKPDLVWQRTSGELAAWYMDGATQTGNVGLGSVADTEWQVVGVVDLNNDTKPDLVWQRTSGELAAWYMDGAVRISNVGLGSVADTNWRIVGH